MKMKRIRRPFILILLLLPLSISCGNGGTQGFDSSIPQTQLLLLDAPGSSCKQQLSSPTDPPDLSSLVAIVNQVQIKWNGTYPLNLVYFHFHFSGDNIASGGFDITYTGTDLAYIWKGTALLPITVQPSVNPTVSASGCQFTVGGITLVDKTKSAFGSGTLLIYATTQTDAAGQNIVPVTSEQYFTYSYTAPQ